MAPIILNLRRTIAGCRGLCPTVVRQPGSRSDPDARRGEAVAALAALAAQPAVPPAGRLHARHRQLERHTPSDAPSPITSSLCIAANGASMRQPMREAERERCAPSTRRTPGVASGKRVAGQRADRDPRDAAQRAEDAGLREQQHVAPRQVDVLVRRVVGGRRAAPRPVGVRVEVGRRRPRARPAAGRATRRRGDCSRRPSERAVPRAPTRGRHSRRPAARRLSAPRARRAPRCRARPRAAPQHRPCAPLRQMMAACVAGRQ